MKYVIGEDQRDIIKDIANESPGVEVCGVVAWTIDRGIYVEALKNIAENQITDFEIADADLSLFQDRTDHSPFPLAIWHTHPLESQPAQLSPWDIANSKASGIPYLLYHPAFGEWDYFDPHNHNPYPLRVNASTDPKTIGHYTEWRFEWNRSDCYTLVRSYYSGMLGVEILDYPRGGADAMCVTSEYWNQLADNFAHAGFRALHRDEEPQNGDVAIATLPMAGVNPHHCVILHDVSTNTGLHIIDNQISATVFYGPALQSRTQFIVRHHSQESAL
mgnify:CR=1 FL=1